MNIKSKYLFSLSLALLVLNTSCEDLVEVDDPRSQLSSAIIFEDDLTATAAVLELYAHMTSNIFHNVTYPTSCSSDDLMFESNVGGSEQIPLYQNEVTSIDPVILRTWLYHYKSIYTSNAIIEGLKKSNKLTSALKDQLMGEAKFFRAHQYFYLVNLFGDIPYIVKTDYIENSVASRMPIADVYERIVKELLEAKAMLTEDYSYFGNERVRVNKWAATALLARVYLYQEDWLHAEEQATAVINKNLFTLSDNLDEVFLKNSSEAILQLIPPYPQQYTPEGQNLKNHNYHPDNPVMSKELINAFEANDKRKTKWVGVGNDGAHTWYYPLKYKEAPGDTIGPDEYSTMLRLAEQYLIRAEARVMQNKLTGAGSAEFDLRVIRARAGLQPTTATTKLDLLLAIEQERRVELFTEGGHRWLDLKRTNRARVVLNAGKPNWDETDVLYPIPDAELLANPRLTQNSGY